MALVGQVNFIISNLSEIYKEPVLFNNTILNNIKFGMKNATDENVFEAAKIANAHEFITNLPEVRIIIIVSIYYDFNRDTKLKLERKRRDCPEGKSNELLLREVNLN